MTMLTSWKLDPRGVLNNGSNNTTVAQQNNKKNDQFAEISWAE